MEVALTIEVRLDADQFESLRDALMMLVAAQERTADALDRIHEYQRVPTSAALTFGQPEKEE